MKRRIESLHIYPIKGMGGIDLESMALETEGATYDRRWMLTDENGIFLSQRDLPELALFKCAIEHGGVEISRNSDRIRFATEEFTGPPLNVQVWKSKLTARETNPEISKWFSDHLSRKVHLVGMTQNSQRLVDIDQPPYNISVSLADGYPYLVLGTGSMNKLNDLLKTPLKINRFRPNIVLNTHTPHEEDTFRKMKSGSAELAVVSKCGRCMVTTIDQETGEQGAEPLKTLATYRRVKNKIYFGVYAHITSKGELYRGSEVEVC